MRDLAWVERGMLIGATVTRFSVVGVKGCAAGVDGTDRQEVLPMIGKFKAGDARRLPTGSDCDFSLCHGDLQ